MLRVKSLPAGHGDCLWLEYGSDSSVHRLLVDGGTAGTYTVLKSAVDALPTTDRRFDLIVVTHIDIDHIDGIVSLFEDRGSSYEVGDVWFNGFPHLPEEHETFGPVSGERLTSALIEKKLGTRATARNWNTVLKLDALADSMP